jgi:hypothetical protein
MKHRFLFFMALVLGIFQSAQSQVPKTISYQGLLTAAGGAPASDGSYTLQFDLFDSLSGGTSQWTETQSGVAVVKGTFNVILGSVTALDIAFNKKYFVEVQAPAGPGIASPQTFSPRSELTSAPYALGPWVTSGQNIYYNNGIVGIGTTNPGFRLDVRDGDINLSNDRYLFATHSSGGSFAPLIGANGSNIVEIGNGVTWDGIGFYCGSVSSERMHITAAGNVGIGTTSPAKKLEVIGNAKVSDTVFASSLHVLPASGPSTLLLDQAAGSRLLLSADGATASVGTPTASILNLYTNNIIRLTLDASGNVGIGTPPTHTLDVGGTLAVSSELSVGTNKFNVTAATGNTSVAGTLGVTGTMSALSDASVSGTLAIGGGTPIVKVISTTSSLNFPSTAAQSASDLTVFTGGAAVGDAVALGLPAVPSSQIVYTAWVSSANNVTVRLNNYSSGSVDPLSAVFRVTVIQF